MRRVVLIHTQGPYAGLYQIVEAWVDPLPEAIGNFEVFDRKLVLAAKTKVTGRAVFYTEQK
jgi:hypothetical protein